MISDATPFEAADLMLAAPGPQIQQHQAQLGEWIRRGGNPNIMRNGMSLMAHLWRGPDTEGKQFYDDARGLRQTARLELIQELVKHGADPWRGQPSLFDIDTKQAHIEPSFLLGIFAEHENAGTKLRGPGGDNPLHSVLRHSDLDLSSFVLKRDTSFVCAAWVNEANTLGNTPLMTLWGERSAQDMKDFQLVRAFGITLDLIVDGYDLTQTNWAGQCVASMIQSYDGIHAFLDALPDRVEHTNDYRLASQIANDRDYLLEQIRVATEHHALTQTTPHRHASIKHPRF
jgi:hypothetical protein